MSLAMFTLEGDRLVPAEIARSLWKHDQMHGVAVSGALARALELRLTELGRDDLRPARYTVDLFQPARMAPCTVETEVVREGRRICLIDAVLLQDGERVARASCIFLLATESPKGDVWTPVDHPQPPPEDLVPPSDEPRVPHFSSESSWSQSFPDHQNAGRKQTWQAGLPVVDGEEGTPFQSVASIADGTSMVVNWGTEGVKFINTESPSPWPGARSAARSACRRPTASSTTGSPRHGRGLRPGRTAGHRHGHRAGQCLAADRLRRHRVRGRRQPQACSRLTRAGPASEVEWPMTAREQRLGTADLAGGQVAYAVTGSGPYLLVVPGWLSHLELGWAIPAERMFYESLAAGPDAGALRPAGLRTLRPVRRAAHDEVELATIAAVTGALGMTQFDVFGFSLGAAVAAQWAADRPEPSRASCCTAAGRPAPTSATTTAGTTCSG